MEGDHGEVVLDGKGEKISQRVGQGDPFQGIEDKGVMGEETPAAGGNRRLQCVPARVERHHDFFGRSGGISHLKPHVIPLFRAAEWGNFINYSNYIRDFRRYHRGPKKKSATFRCALFFVPLWV